MTGALAGGLLGFVAASGAVIAIRAAPPMRPIRLAERVAPYLGDTPSPSKLLARPTATSAPFAVARRIFGPTLGEIVAGLERMVGGTASVRRRLGGLGTALTVEEFRIEQIVWGAGGLTLGALLLAFGGVASGKVDPVLVGGAAMVGMVVGVLGRDWFLTRQLERREQTMLNEFPVIADLLALSVIAGEAPAEALARVSRLVRGEMSRDVESALARARSGLPLTKALTEVAERATLEPFARFIAGLVIAIERGTPLAEVLRAQAGDVREMSNRALLEAGGKKEISMMLPVNS
ncbi:MAG: type II secretion system F family protein, partial [Actinomycetota bacterium]|nr:type II secretion system F family protein [Actinomycetota bacterium]